MIEIILAYDDEDTGDEENDGLDFFYIACARDVIKFFNTENYNLQQVNGNNLNMDYINKTIQELNNSKFLFLAYSHGSDNALLHDNQNTAYLIVNKNTHLFSKSLFYTWSCLCGKELGPDLINKGCYTFIGYDDYIMAGTGELPDFIHCANYGIEMLIEDKTTGEAFDKMIENYTNKIDYFVNEKDDFFIANFFRKNRDALVINGNRKMTIKDMSKNI